MIDREALEQAWRRAFDEELEQGLERVRLLVGRFGLMDLFEREGPEGKAAFDSTWTSIEDKDFARVAVLAAVGATSLGEVLFPQQIKLLGGTKPCDRERGFSRLEAAAEEAQAKYPGESICLACLHPCHEESCEEGGCGCTA